ncbi:hypothetical protein G4U52_000571 [Neisseria gonorrhoeae]
MSTFVLSWWVLANISILGTMHKASPDEGCRGGIIRDFREKYGSRTKGRNAALSEQGLSENKKKPSFENSAFLLYLVGRERFERSTNGLKVRCSTD